MSLFNELLNLSQELSEKIKILKSKAANLGNEIIKPT
jgi:hypothetical protein